MELPLLLRQGPMIRESFKRFTDYALEAVGDAARDLKDKVISARNTDSYKPPDKVITARKWNDEKYEILQDIKPVILLTKDILYSQRYMNGAVLTEEDEEDVVDNLLAYHPFYEDKIGSGLQSIMVDQHPIFRNSRCLFVIRTDGSWIDFSHQKCLQEYIMEEYPTHAERFIREYHHISALNVIGSGLINGPNATQGEGPKLRIPTPTHLFNVEIPS